jgi:50S ribosomal subunit-associated GTPase HflX
MVFNKCDMVEKTKLSFAKKKWLELYPHAVFISAKEKEGLSALLERFDEFIQKSSIFVELNVPNQMENLLRFLRQNAEIIEENENPGKDENTLRLHISRQLYPAVIKQIENYHLLKYIHK